MNHAFVSKAAMSSDCTPHHCGLWRWLVKKENEHRWSPQHVQLLWRDWARQCSQVQDQSICTVHFFAGGTNTRVRTPWIWAPSCSFSRMMHVYAEGNEYAVTQGFRQDGSCCLQADQLNLLGWSPSPARGVRACSPGEKFGKMEPIPACLCILEVKSEWLQNSLLTKMIQKIEKRFFGRLSGPLWPGGRVLPIPRPPPPPRTLFHYGPVTRAKAKIPMHHSWSPCMRTHCLEPKHQFPKCWRNFSTHMHGRLQFSVKQREREVNF